MSSWIWKANIMILVMTVSAPRCSECAVGGRNLTQNEFPYTVFITSPKAPAPTTCMGVLHGSITVVSTAGCFDASRPNGSTIRTAKNVFSTEQPESYPTMNLRFSDQEGATFSFAILNLAMPGLMVDPFTYEVGNNVTNEPVSSGVRVAEWFSDHGGIRQLTNLNITGVVATPDRRVVAMQLINMHDCITRFRRFSPSTFNFANTSDITNDAMCAVRAAGPQIHKRYEPVPPGYVCDSDVGSPFVYEDHVIGLLVKAYCVNETSALSVFLTILPTDNVDKVDDVVSSSTTRKATHPSTLTSTRRTTSSWRPKTSPKKHGAGLSIHCDRFRAWTVLSVMILTVRF